jgi:hypothetical protein
MVAGFTSTTFCYVKHSLNEPAHVLAKTFNLASVGFISDSAPDCIRKTLCVDVFLINKVPKKSDSPSRVAIPMRIHITMLQH